MATVIGERAHLKPLRLGALKQLDTIGGTARRPGLLLTHETDPDGQHRIGWPGTLPLRRVCHADTGSAWLASAISASAALMTRSEVFAGRGLLEPCRRLEQTSASANDVWVWPP